jgi:hypothetical protein
MLPPQPQDQKTGRTLPCSKCLFVADSEREHRRHKRSCIDKPSDKPRCPSCHNQFSPTGLTSHLLVCTSAKSPQHAQFGFNPHAEYQSATTNDGQIKNHSAKSSNDFRTHVHSNPPPSGAQVERNPKIQYPRSNDKRAWNLLNSKLEEYVEYNFPQSVRRVCPIDELAETTDSLIFDFLFKNCGVKPPLPHFPQKTLCLNTVPTAMPNYANSKIL